MNQLASAAIAHAQFEPILLLRSQSPWPCRPPTATGKRSQLWLNAVEVVAWTLTDNCRRAFHPHLSQGPPSGGSAFT